MLIVGTNRDDVLRLPDDQSNRVEARGGNDTVSGGALADLIWLGDGDDRAETSGADRVHGGAGKDRITLWDGPGSQAWGDGGNDKIDVWLGQATVWGGDGNDWIRGRSYGDAPNNRLFGGAGNDTIMDTGTSELYGEAGADHLISADASYLSGGSGNDRLEIYSMRLVEARLNGGSGSDTFVIDVWEDGLIETTRVEDCTSLDRLEITLWYDDPANPAGVDNYDAREVFALLDSNGDGSLTVKDRPTWFGDVVYGPGGSGISLKIGEDVVHLPGVTALADWQFVV